MSIVTIAQAEKILQGYIPSVANYSGDGMSLDRMWPLLEAVGNPHEKLKTIHIAGTSGKTSTAYYIAALLASANKKVGLTVSPHVDSITERVQINGKPVTDSVFCQDLEEFLKLIKDVKPTPTYFELMIVFVLWDFHKQGVDYAVIETGMGGLLDGTNVVSRNNKVCVITDIGLDHMHILGNTVSEIAAQKVGIIHEHNHVFMYDQPEEVMMQVKKRVEDKHAILHITANGGYKTQIATKSQFEKLPLFQQRNWRLALEASMYVSERDGFRLKDLDPHSVVVPGRMERTQLEDGSLLIMDGSHNGQKVSAFVDSFKAIYPGQKAHIMIALKEGKEYTSVLSELQDIADSLVVTTFSTSQDLPAVSQDPESITQHAKYLGIDTVTISNHYEAYAQLVNSSAKIKLIIGSFYLLSQIR